MPVIYEPTLIKSSEILTANAGGGNVDIGFTFGINEGAKIEKVLFLSYMPAGVTGQCVAGLNLRPEAGDPIVWGIEQDDDVFAAMQCDEEAAAWVEESMNILNFKEDSIYIVKDMTGQIWAAGAAGDRTVYIKIYYKRVRFSDAEMGNLLRNY